MLTRRRLIMGAALLAACCSPLIANAADSRWPEIKELTLAAIPVENASMTMNRFQPMADYLSKEIGIPIKLRIANDYAAVIEGQRAGNAHIAFYGPASYARAVMTGVKTEPLVNQRHDSGANGYYSILWVKNDSPYKTLEDLKGKTLAFVDPNSTSGNNAPRYFLAKEGIKVDQFFAKTFYAGSHENAVLAVAQGTADAAANLWNSADDNLVARLSNRGFLKDASGKVLNPSDFRVLYKSTLLPEGPFSVLTSLPADLRQALRQAFLEMPKKDKAAFDALSDGKDQEFVSVSAKDYEPIIGMLEFNDQARKEK